MSKPELLAPAGSMEALIAALRCGADAVYVGAKQFSARAYAENFNSAGLAEAASRCHLYGAKLYLAVNTLVFDGEFAALDALLADIAAAGADGCIVQDLGAAAYISQRLPTLRLHASTQLTVHTPAGLRFAQSVGFCRAVLARELSAKQIAEISAEAKRIGMETEVFVHGAHCMSVSGQCWMSAAMGGRSANRGCCAQPCRLPFTADPAQRNACALSLKDQSLVEHLGEMCEIGVDSLKIEGRMKRPEYVAAAVSACRSALDGQQPDLRTLRAVFSRSGFTDGYFTGRRQEMFGTRQKEDVTAAQDVLPKLREKYQNPRKIVQIDAAYSLQADVPAALTVRGDDGCCVTVRGEIPQIAQSRPTDADQLRRQFGKLGGTVYTAGTVTAEIGSGLMLPAAALNALRREAVAEMDRCRIRANTPVHTLSSIPPVPAPAAVPETGIRLQIRHSGQLDAVSKIAQELEFLLIPLHLVQGFLRSTPDFPRDRIMVVPPRFVCNEQAVLKMLRAAADAGIRHIACGHVGDVQLGRELELSLHGGQGLHIANARAAAVFRDAGLTDGLRAPEAPHEFSTKQALPLGIFAYGRLPLMLTRNCPVQHQVGCVKCKHQLIDRKGAAPYVDCTRCTEKPDYAEIFNAVPVWMADRPAAYRNAAFLLLSMTDESPERICEIVKAYAGGGQIPPPKQFTRGLQIKLSPTD